MTITRIYPSQAKVLIRLESGCDVLAKPATVKLFKPGKPRTVTTSTLVYDDCGCTRVYTTADADPKWTGVALQEGSNLAVFFDAAFRLLKGRYTMAIAACGMETCLDVQLGPNLNARLILPDAGCATCGVVDWCPA